MQQINWGIIGCGNVTEKKSGPAFQKVSGSNLVAVMRRDGELAKSYAQRHGVPTWYTSADELIADPNVNAVYIATPPSTHMELALKVIESGKPVYVEKPMALTYQECQTVLQSSKANGVKVYVAYYRRALPYFLKIRELLLSGVIGEVRSVSVYQCRKAQGMNQDHLPWRYDPQIAGGGLFHDLGCHTLDVLDMLLGTISHASGHQANQSHRYPVADIVTASFQFESGALGTGIWCFDAHEDMERNEIVGTHGKIRFETFTFAPIELHTADGVQKWTLDPPEHIQQPLIQTIVEELRGCGSALSTGETAIRTSWVMDAICGNL